MTDTGEIIYQIVRFAFTGSLLLFLYLLVRASVREMTPGPDGIVGLRQQESQVAYLHIEDGAASQLAAGDLIEVARRAVIGRAPECTLLADDPSVSSVHAALFAANGGWFIEDFGSTNGTYVSGKPVTQVTAVDNGELIQIGRVRMRLMC